MFRWRHDRPGTNTTVDTTGWLDAPPGAWPGRILGGLVLPLILVAVGSYCIATRYGLIVGRGWHEVRGAPAVALGISALGAALFFHAHAFWGPVWRLAIIRELGRVVGALVFIGGFGYTLWSILWLG